MKALLVLSISLFLLCSCAEEQVIMKTDIPVKPQAEAPGKSIGSLWSEASIWNDMFSSQSFRSEGDIVFLRPTGRFNRLIAKKLGKDASFLPEKGRNPASTDSDPMLAATILTKHIRGIYSVKAHQTRQIEGAVQEIKVNGKIREVDLNNDDTVSLDKVFDLEIDVKMTSDPEKKSKEKRKKA